MANASMWALRGRGSGSAIQFCASMNAWRITNAVPKRVEGVFFFSPYTVFGFSPSADFKPLGERSTISSMYRPCVCMATASPPMGFPEPGFTLTAVIPPASASSKPGSKGSTASMARTPAMTGSVISLTSLVEPSSPSGSMPTCTCASMKPGSSHWPWASSTSAPSGIWIDAPNPRIFPPSTSTVPSNGAPSTGTTWAFVMARTRFLAAAAASRMVAPMEAVFAAGFTGTPFPTAFPTFFAAAGPPGFTGTEPGFPAGAAALRVTFPGVNPELGVGCELLMTAFRVPSGDTSKLPRLFLHRPLADAASPA